MIHEDAQLSQIRELCKLMTNCWRSDPDIRPTARLCQSILKWMASPSTFNLMIILLSYNFAIAISYSGG